MPFPLPTEKYPKGVFAYLLIIVSFLGKWKTLPDFMVLLRQYRIYYERSTMCTLLLLMNPNIFTT